MSRRSDERTTAWRVSLVFTALGLLWTALTSSGWTDRATGGTRTFAPLHAAMDVLFVLGAALLLHTLVRRGFARARAAEERAQEALRSGSDRYRDLFESATDILVTHDWEGRLTALNRAGEQALGISRSAAIGRPLHQLVAPEDLAAAEALLGRVRRGGGTARADLSLLSADGSRVPVEVSAHAIEHEDRPVGILCIARDVRPRQALEGQLRQAQKMEAIGRLGAGVAHDLNNALTAIAGYAGLSAARLPPGDPAAVELAGILAATGRATALTRQLLALSRRQPVAPRVLDLNAVLADLALTLPRLLGEDIELAVEPLARPATVLADLGQVEQVIMNLCVNARDAMPHGGRLRLATSNADWGTPVAPSRTGPASDAYVVLSVEDEGTGMDSETRARVFEPFFTTRAGSHSGLGLSTVYGIVSQSRGAITFESAPGAGTTFRVLLPLALPDEHATPLPAADLPRAGHETILLVEDDELVRELARRFLERYRYRVLEAPDAAAALELSDATPGRIDLLLSDVVMPRMNGPELAAELQRRRPGVRVVFVSGYADAAPTSPGAVGTVLHKPFSELDLVRKVRQALDAPAGPGAPSDPGHTTGGAPGARTAVAGGRGEAPGRSGDARRVASAPPAGSGG